MTDLLQSALEKVQSLPPVKQDRIGRQLLDTLRTITQTPPKKIEQLVVPSGDWFRIGIEHGGKEGKPRYIMTRVIAWAVISQESLEDRLEYRLQDRLADRVEGIDAHCFDHVDDYLDYVYVYGDDLAPDGRTWRNVFNETPSFNWGIKDISDFAAEALPE